MEFDFDEAPPLEPASSTALTRSVKETTFVEAFEVVNGREKVTVAANAIANRAMAQINVGRLRAMGMKVISMYTDRNLVPSPKEFKAIVDGFAVIEDMAGQAYGTKSGAEGGLSNSIERMVAAAAAGGAAGAQMSNYRTREGRLQRLKQLGKQKIIDVTSS